MQKISVLMVGTGGYAGVYVKELLHDPRARQFQIVGAVDPYVNQNKSGQDLILRGVPIYNTVEEFYQVQTAQLAIVATPIYLHACQTQYCMEHGSDVLCEKPICAILRDAEEMMTVRNRTGRRLAIGFQWSFSKSILKLKQNIIEGMYGRIRRIRTIVYFPRNLDYYHRGTGWAGKRCLDSGEWLLDSIASNGASHYLHNMLFLVGDKIDQSSELVRMEAEVYQTNPIEMFDTCVLRIRTVKDTELLFYATHAVPYEEKRDPEFILEGEKGIVTMSYQDGQEHMTGRMADGRIIYYEAPSIDNMRKLYCMADAIRENISLTCIPETALPHLNCICALAESFPVTPRFPDEFIHYDESVCQYSCKGLGKVLNQCWKKGSLPYEEGIKWAQTPHEILFRRDRG